MPDLPLDEMRGRAAEAWPDLIAHGGPWVFDDGALDRLAISGGTVAPHVVRERRAALAPDDLATIVYTSGTTGPPRGVRLTHGSLAVHAANTVPALRPVVWDGTPRLLLFLPMAHVYARVIGLVCVASRTTVGFSPSATTLAADARSFRPTYLVAVPRVLEKVYTAAEATAGGGLRRRVFAWARTQAEASSRAARPGASRPGRALADALVFRRLRRVLGGRLRTVIVGGAALHPSLAHFFRGAGIDLLEGYGLTETCAQTTVNRPGTAVVGSVGTPLPGCRVRIAAGGEIEVAGQHLFVGYEGEPPRREEWFATGDLGRLDSAGNLYVTGRVKDVIVTASGKNVSPGPLEDAVRAHPLVGECLVVGEGRPFVAALLFLDEEQLAAWCGRRGRPPLDRTAATADLDLHAELAAVVASANAGVSRAESIREFVVVDHPLTVAGGQMTPSLKVRRADVLAQLAPVVDDLYAHAAERRVGPQ